MTIPQGALPQWTLPKGTIPQGPIKKGTIQQGTIPQETLQQGWLIYRQADLAANRVFAERLVAAATRQGLSLRIVIHETLNFGVGPDGLYAQAAEDIAPPAFAIQRAVDPFLAMHLEAMGVRVFNRAAVSAMCNDKAWTYQAICQLQIPMLPTRFADLQGLRALGPDLREPVVVKAVGGRSGKQVHLVLNATEWDALCAQLPTGRYVVQPLGGLPGVDIRVFVVGKQIIAAIRREASQDGQGDFRANFSMGGNASTHQLTLEQETIVMKVVQSFPFDYVGIDFLLDARGGFLFNEIEDAVGSRTLSVCTDIDIADLFLAHVSNSL